MSSTRPPGPDPATDGDALLELLCTRRLDAVAYRRVYVDLTSPQRSGPDRTGVEVVVAATGARADASVDVLGVDVGDSESTRFWQRFFHVLRLRGLHGVEQIVASEEHAGLAEAVSTMFPHACVIVDAQFSALSGGSLWRPSEQPSGPGPQETPRCSRPGPTVIAQPPAGAGPAPVGEAAHEPRPGRAPAGEASPDGRTRRGDGVRSRRPGGGDRREHPRSGDTTRGLTRAAAEAIDDELAGRLGAAAEFPVLFVEATPLSSPAGAVPRESFVTVSGVTAGGPRQALTLAVGDPGAPPFWERLFRDLTARGVGGVQFVVSERLPGVEAAVAGWLPGARWRWALEWRDESVPGAAKRYAGGPRR